MKKKYIKHLYTIEARKKVDYERAIFEQEHWFVLECSEFDFLDANLKKILQAPLEIYLRQGYIY